MPEKIVVTIHEGWAKDPDLLFKAKQDLVTDLTKQGYNVLFVGYTNVGSGPGVRVGGDGRTHLLIADVESAS